jgi:hypothetical protein
LVSVPNRGRSWTTGKSLPTDGREDILAARFAGAPSMPSDTQTRTLIGFTIRIRCSIVRCAGLAILSVQLAAFGGCHNHKEQPITLKYLQDGWVQPADMPAIRAMSEEFAHLSGNNLEVIRGVPVNPSISYRSSGSSCSSVPTDRTS